MCLIAVVCCVLLKFDNVRQEVLGICVEALLEFGEENWRSIMHRFRLRHTRSLDVEVGVVHYCQGVVQKRCECFLIRTQLVTDGFWQDDAPYLRTFIFSRFCRCSCSNFCPYNVLQVFPSNQFVVKSALVLVYADLEILLLLVLIVDNAGTHRLTITYLFCYFGPFLMYIGLSKEGEWTK